MLPIPYLRSSPPPDACAVAFLRREPARSQACEMGQVLPGGETQKSLMYLSLEQGRENVGRSLGRREESKQFFQAGFMPFDQGIDTRV